VTLHRRTVHPEFQEGCFGCKIGTLTVGYCGRGGLDLTREKQWDSELNRFESAVKQGIQPETTRTRDIRAAEEWSNHFGTAYSAEVALERQTNKARELVE